MGEARRCRGLAGSTTDAEGAVLDVLVVMGGVKLRVPRDWRVSLELMALMGAAVDKTSSPEGDTEKVLRVRGLVLMGGIEVVS